MGAIVPVNDPACTKVKPVTNAEVSAGSRPAEVSIPVIVNSETPPAGKKNWTPASRVTCVEPKESSNTPSPTSGNSTEAKLGGLQLVTIRLRA